MPITVTAPHVGRSVDYLGSRKVRFLNVALGVYATGGVPITLGQLGFSTEVEFILFCPVGVTYSFAYDYTNNKIIAIKGDGTQEADTTDLSAVNVRLMAIGR